MSSAEAHRLLEELQHQSPLRDLVAEHSVAELPSDASDDDRSAHSLEQPADSELPSLPRSLTYLNGLALVAGLQIGSGIFSAISAVRTHVSSSTVAIFEWLLSGVLVWSGAASFIELGTRVPQNGGIQEYLRHCYGDIYGFCLLASDFRDETLRHGHGSSLFFQNTSSKLFRLTKTCRRGS